MYACIAIECSHSCLRQRHNLQLVTKVSAAKRLPKTRFTVPKIDTHNLVTRRISRRIFNHVTHDVTFVYNDAWFDVISLLFI